MPSSTSLSSVRADAIARRDRGDLNGARLLLERALEAATMTSGEDHPEVLGTAHLLAKLHRQSGDLAGARRVLESALYAGSHRHGDEHPLLLAISFDLAEIADELGNRHEARRHYTKVARYGPAAPGFDQQQVQAARGWLGPNAPAIAPVQGLPVTVPAPEPLIVPPPVTPAIAERSPAPPPPPPPVAPRPSEEDRFTAPDRPVYFDPPVTAPPVRPEPPAPTQAPTYSQPPAFIQPPAVSQPPVFVQPPVERFTSTPRESVAPETRREPVMPRDSVTQALPQVTPREPVLYATPAPPAPVVIGPVAAAASPAPQPKRGRGVLIASLSAAAVAVVAAAVTVALVLLPRPAGNNPDPVPTGPEGAPSEVSLLDRGDRITLTWTDPSNGVAQPILVGFREDEGLRRFGVPAKGATEHTLLSLNKNYEYCFSIVLAYSDEDLRQSEQVCTNRKKASPSPTR